MNICMYCDAPAHYKNSTQFAGTHYYCIAHAAQEPDCDEFSYIIYESDVKTKILSDKIVELYHVPTATTVQGQGRSQHRAYGEAWTKLNKHLQELMAFEKPKQECRSPYCECPQDQCKEGKLDLREVPLKENITKAITQMNEQYLLDKLQEEAAEIIQAVSKIRRFGKHNHHPERTTTNLQELVGELEDLQAIVLALEEIQYLDPKPSTIATIKKFNTLISN